MLNRLEIWNQEIWNQDNVIQKTSFGLKLIQTFEILPS